MATRTRTLIIRRTQGLRIVRMPFPSKEFWGLVELWRYSRFLYTHSLREVNTELCGNHRRRSFISGGHIHARTEWETPQAMAKAAQSINALELDLVIVGGDLITDGFQSSAASVAPRWDAYLASMHRRGLSQ